MLFLSKKENVWNSPLRLQRKNWSLFFVVTTALIITFPVLLEVCLKTYFFFFQNQEKSSFYSEGSQFSEENRCVFCLCTLWKRLNLSGQPSDRWKVMNTGRKVSPDIRVQIVRRWKQLSFAWRVYTDAMISTSQVPTRVAITTMPKKRQLDIVDVWANSFVLSPELIHRGKEAAATKSQTKYANTSYFAPNAPDQVDTDWDQSCAQLTALDQVGSLLWGSFTLNLCLMYLTSCLQNPS